MYTAKDDERIAALIRDEAARFEQAEPPPLADLSATAAARARTRRGHVAAAIGATAALAVGTVALSSSGPTTIVPGGTSQVTRPPSENQLTPTGVAPETFEVPTYEGNIGLFANIFGVVSFTADGCPVLGGADSSNSAPLILPNAVGRRSTTGPRTVVDADTNRVLAVEGQAFQGVGGFVPGKGEFAQAWERLCPGLPVRNQLAVIGTVLNSGPSASG